MSSLITIPHPLSLIHPPTKNASTPIRHSATLSLRNNFLLAVKFFSAP
jgi:hypothetical protein